MIAVIILVLGLGAIGYLWKNEHPQIIDRGDGPGNKRAFWNPHSKLHLVGAGIVAFPGAVFNGFLAGLAVSLVLCTLVEIAQRFPHDKQGGYFEWADLWWDYVGAFLGAWLGGLIGSLV